VHIGKLFLEITGILITRPDAYVVFVSFHLVIRVASWNGLIKFPQNELLRTAAQNVAQSLGSHPNRCVLKLLSTRSFTFTPAPLQKPKESSKRKATENAASDSDDDAQPSEEDQRPSVKTVKTVKKVCESTRITCQSGSRRTAAKNFLHK